jgi:monoterpene epsilon-lactone hydrolase
MKKALMFTAMTLAACTIISFAVWSQGPAPERSITLNPDGALAIKNVTVPLSSLMSEGGRKVLMRSKPTEGPGAPVPVPSDIPDMAKLRQVYNENLKPVVDHMREVFPVDIQETTIDGISAAIVTPKGGVPERNKNRLMLNGPGGGYRTGVRGNGLLISIPVAATLGVKVITITYRQGPEYRFPAASEDLITVYKNVLKTYKPKNIGMFGCSAGGQLVSQTTAILIRDGLPTPGALGVYCAGLGSIQQSGDAQFFGSLAVNNVPTTPTQIAASAAASGPNYFTGIDMNQFVVQPTLDEKQLAKFPPTIFFTGTRDFLMSAAAFSYRKLLKVGVDSQLLIFDGLYHGFMTNPDFPESQEGYKIAAAFFDKHLGRD